MELAVKQVVINFLMDHRVPHRTVIKETSVVTPVNTLPSPAPGLLG